MWKKQKKRTATKNSKNTRHNFKFSRSPCSRQMGVNNAVPGTSAEVERISRSQKMSGVLRKVSWTKKPSRRTWTSSINTECTRVERTTRPSLNPSSLLWCLNNTHHSLLDEMVKSWFCCCYFSGLVRVSTKFLCGAYGYRLQYFLFYVYANDYAYELFRSWFAHGASVASVYDLSAC